MSDRTLINNYASGSPPPSSNLVTSPTIRVNIDWLRNDVTDFDLFALLPPHVQPPWFDLPPSNPNGMRPHVWASFVFDQLEPAILCWIHIHHLRRGGHLAHLEASADGNRNGLMVKLAPGLDHLVFMFEAARTIIPNPTTSPLHPMIHISNIVYTSTPADIHQALIPHDLASAVLHIDILPKGVSLSRPFPYLSDAQAKKLVGRVNIYFDSMENAAACFNHLDSVEVRDGALMKLRHMGANRPMVLSPGVMWVMMVARRQGRDEAIHALLESAYEHDDSWR